MCKTLFRADVSISSTIYIAFKGSFCSRFPISIPSYPLNHYILDVPPTSNTHPGCLTTFSSRHKPVTRHSNNSTPLTAPASTATFAGQGQAFPMNISDKLRKHLAFSAAGVVPFPEAFDGYLNYDAGELRYSGGAELRRSLSHAVPNPTWRIDGAIFGTRYFATPLFLLPDFPPLRIDVVIPDQLDRAQELWGVLGASDSVHMHDERVANLGISRYLILLLDSWSSKYPDFERIYRGLPFGSSIVVRNIGLKLSESRIRINRNIQLPSHLLSISALQELWKLQDDSMPVAVDLHQLRFVKRLFSSICLIEHAGKPMIFKSNTQSPSSIYHEIKVLLSLPPHPNIVGPPKALVTISSDSHSEKYLICGFLLDYYELGSLESYLPQIRDSHSLNAQDQLRWSLELASALIHIHSQVGMFYSDLKMDNILLRLINGKMSIVLVDFEQSRNLYTWAPPEVFYVEWIAELSFRGLTRIDGLNDQSSGVRKGVGWLGKKTSGLSSTT